MTTQQSRAIHILLWVAQVLLAGTFFLAGFLKISTPRELEGIMPWSAQLPWDLVRIIGIAEVFAAIGLILPSLLRFRPYITPIAAGGLTLIQAFAVIFHGSRGEYSAMLLNLVLVALSFLIAWGRGFIVPIKDREKMEMQHGA